MRDSIEYKGYTIKIEYNKKDKNYPYIAVARNGFEEIRKRGYDEQQAIDLTTALIDFTIASQELKKGEKL
ncbi:MAG: hypothetical protein WC123_06835 [Bacilli bacterium]